MQRRTFLSLFAASPKQPLYSLAWRPDGALLALGGFREVRLVDPASGEVKTTLSGNAEAVRSIAFSSDGKRIAAGGGFPSRKGEVKIWDVAAKEAVATIQGHSDCVYSVAFSPDGSTVASASYDKMIYLWDAATGKQIRPLKDHIDAVYCVAFTPDGKRLVSGSADRGVKIWNIETGERLYTFSDATDAVNAIALDGTGKRVAAAGADKTIRIWSLGERGGNLLNTLIAHEDAILQLAWSPDSSMIVSSSADRVIKVFSAPDLTEKKNLPSQSDWVTGLRFHPNSHSFAASRFDGSYQIFKL